jgi:hypothetical protein
MALFARRPKMPETPPDSNFLYEDQAIADAFRPLVRTSFADAGSEGTVPQSRSKAQLPPDALAVELPEGRVGMLRGCRPQLNASRHKVLNRRLAHEIVQQLDHMR